MDDRQSEHEADESESIEVDVPEIGPVAISTNRSNGGSFMKPTPATPSCSNTRSSFEDSLNKILPLPTTHLLKIAKRRTAQSAVELTSSPYKVGLEEKKKQAEEKVKFQLLKVLLKKSP